MVLIYAHDPTLGVRIVPLVSKQHIVVTTWPDVRRQAAAVRACILVFSSLEGVNLPERLRELRRLTVHAPVLIVLPLSEGHASTLATVRVDRVLWEHQLDDPTRARDLLAVDPEPPQQRFAEAVRAADWTPAADRNRLAALCESDPPPADTVAAARLIGESPSDLRRKVSPALGGVPGHATDYLLQWLRLLWACDPARTGQKEPALARGLGTTMRTLQRTAKGLTGVTLDELRRDPEGVLRMALRACRLGEE